MMQFAGAVIHAPSRQSLACLPLTQRHNGVMTVTPSGPEESVQYWTQTFAQSLEQELGETAHIEMQYSNSFGGQILRVTPRRSDACSVEIAESKNEIILGIGHGGRWELGHDASDVSLAKSLVEAVIEGRVNERFGLFLSRVTVTTKDGKSRSSLFGGGTLWKEPTPGWPHRGQKFLYSPYT
jgi:hypothetical protein